MTLQTFFIIYVTLLGTFIFLNYRFWAAIGKDDDYEYYNTNQECSERTPRLPQQK